MLLLLAVAPAAARSEKTLGYARDQVWATCVRFIVVDERAKVVDKDPDAGYLLFEVKDEGKTYRGSLELASVMIDGRISVRFVIQLDDRPAWLEVAMLQRLERKLRSELGAPPNAKKKEPEPPPKPDDKDKDKDKPKTDDDGPRISPTP